MRYFIALSWLLATVSFSAPARHAHQLHSDGPLTENRANMPSHVIVPGSDRGLYNYGFLEGDIFVDSRRPPVKNAVTDANMLWPHGIVVYKVEDDVGCPASQQCEILKKAMDHYQSVSCIRFKEWTGEDNYVSIFFNSERSGDCWSSVGRLGNGKQRLSLGQRCWYDGIVIHELGHAIGFWHEMNRPDRDAWIHVYWNNITPGFTSAFAKYDEGKVDTLGETFDYDSIMMYDEYAFSKDGTSPTLLTTGGVQIGPIWKKAGLSPSDQRRLNRLYQCEGTTPHREYPYDISCTFDRNACGFTNVPKSSSSWQRKSINQTSGYIQCSSEKTPSKLVSAVLPGPAVGDTSRGPIGCLRFYYMLKSQGTATLQVEQVFVTSSAKWQHNTVSGFPLWTAKPAAVAEWRHVELPIYVTSPFQLIFTAKFDGDDGNGVAALDVFEMFYNSCTNRARAGTPAPADTPS